MAASFLLAFTLGVMIRSGPWSRFVATDGPGAVNGPRSDQVAAGPAGSLLDDDAEQPLDNVRLVWDGPPGETQSIELPVVEGKSLDEEWLRSQPSAFPAAMLQALEKLGHRVEQRRELVPLDMQDGRRLVVPVDQVEVQPVSNRRAYQ
jgi:hypothetical protein